MVSEGALAYSNSPCHCPKSHSAILDEPSAIVWHKRPLLGSMNRSLNHSSTPTVVIIDQWLRLSANKVPNLPQLPQSKPAPSLMKSLRQPPGMPEPYCIPQELACVGGGGRLSPTLKKNWPLAFPIPTNRGGLKPSHTQGDWNEEKQGRPVAWTAG